MGSDSGKSLNWKYLQSTDKEILNSLINMFFLFMDMNMDWVLEKTVRQLINYAIKGDEMKSPKLSSYSVLRLLFHCSRDCCWSVVVDSIKIVLLRSSSWQVPV